MAINRRSFLQVLLGAMAGSQWPLVFAEATEVEQNLIVGGGKYRDLDTGKEHFVFSTVDLERDFSRQIPTDFLPHGVHSHPDEHTRLAVFEKKGPGACEIDLKAQKIIRKITTDETRYFYGHGVYSADGSIIYCTESYLDSFDGIIAMRDSETLKYLGEFPSYGKEPHECQLIDGGKTMIITNGGGDLQGDAPTVTYVDVENHQLIHKELLTNSRLNTGHLAVGQDGSLVVVSAPRAGLGETELGGVSIQPRGAELESIAQPLDVVDKMNGEALSVAIHEEAGIAAVTHPGGDMVTFWSIRKRKLLKTMDLPKPRGVTLTTDSKQFLISFGPLAEMMAIDVASLSQVPDSRMQSTYLTGSHIYNWSRGLHEILAPGPLV